MEEQTPQPNTLEDMWKKASKNRKYALIAGFLSLVVTIFITVENMGFTSPNSSDISGFMTEKTMWIVNVSIGIFSGIMFFPKKIIPGIIAGGITTAAITGLTILYTSFRGELYMLELLIPFFISLYIGFLVLRLTTVKAKK